MLEGFGISKRVLIKQFLEGAPIVQTSANLFDELVGDVDRKTASLDPTVEYMAGVLLTGETGLAVFADAGAAPQAEGAESGRPETDGLVSEPVFDVEGRFGFGWHGVCVPYNTHTSQGKNDNC